MRYFLFKSDIGVNICLLINTYILNMDSRFEGLRQRLEELQVHVLATSNNNISSSSQSSSRQKQKNKTEPKWPTETLFDKDISNKPKDMSHRKPNLEEYEAPVTPKKHRQQPPVLPAPAQKRFQSAISSSKSVLNSHPTGDAATVSGLLSRLREEEQKRISERAALQMQLQKEKQRALHAETAARRAEDQRDFRLGEVTHLKAALKRRDDVITSLQDQVREMEVGISYADAVQLAHGKGTGLSTTLRFFVLIQPWFYFEQQMDMIYLINLFV